MTGLEQTFYIMAIVYMGIMFLITLALVIAIFAIKAKVNAIHKKIDEKLAPVKAVVEAGEKVMEVAKAMRR